MTTLYLHATKTPLQRRRTKWLVSTVLAAVGAFLLLVPARRASAFLFDIVLDPFALVENVLKIVDFGEQVDALVQQIENQVKQLEHLGSSVTSDISAIVSGIKGKLDASLYGTLADQLNTRYPPDMSRATWTEYQTDQSNWITDQRQALAENRQVENQVFQDMDSTTRSIQDIVDASNSASGETAALQAHNDLLATASAELAKLQALRVARSRLRTEQLAQEQSELSFAEAERQRVRADNPAPPTQTVVDPFPNALGN